MVDMTLREVSMKKRVTIYCTPCRGINLPRMRREEETDVVDGVLRRRKSSSERCKVGEVLGRALGNTILRNRVSLYQCEVWLDGVLAHSVRSGGGEEKRKSEDRVG